MRPFHSDTPGPWLKLISPTNAHRAGLQANVRIESADNEPLPSLCQIIAIRPIGVDQTILADPPDKGQNKTPIQIVGQFDGSCHRTEQLGGAGYVIYTIEGGISRVLACRAVALPRCSDNVESEILACLFLVEEIATLIRQIASERNISPKVVIQGDILPVVKYFQFAGRLRRIDMTQPLEQIRTLVSLHIPCTMFLYQPRVANIVADNLAGQASDFMIECYRQCPTSFNREAGPVSIRPTFPAPLLQMGGFHIQCPAQPWAHPALTLVEKPMIDHGLLRKHLTKHPHHRQLISRPHGSVGMASLLWRWQTAGGGSIPRWSVSKTQDRRPAERQRARTKKTSPPTYWSIPFPLRATILQRWNWLLPQSTW